MMAIHNRKCQIHVVGALKSAEERPGGFHPNKRALHLEFHAASRISVRGIAPDDDPIAKVTQCIESRLLRAHQIPHHWYDVLVTLEKAPDQRLRMSELAENVVTSKSTLTRIVDRLEAEGLLRRESCPDDRRGSFAVLTEAGAKARLAAWPVVSRGIAELFASSVKDEEAHVVAETLQRVADAATDTANN
jgi:DNA-binding MarR family transcriptional regulator